MLYQGIESASVMHPARLTQSSSQFKTRMNIRISTWNTHTPDDPTSTAKCRQTCTHPPKANQVNQSVSRPALSLLFFLHVFHITTTCPNKGVAACVWDFWGVHRCWCVQSHMGTVLIPWENWHWQLTLWEKSHATPGNRICVSNASSLYSRMLYQLSYSVPIFQNMNTDKKRSRILKWRQTSI